MRKYNYKDLLSEKNLLKVQQRARALMRDGTDLIAIKYSEKQLIFKTRSGTDRRVVWTQIIQLDDVSIQNILEGKTYKSVEDLIKYSGLHCHCFCPSWHYWGMQYKGTKLGYALIPERRRPTRLNRMPNRIPYLCKHIFLIMQLYPFWSKALASKFKNWADKKVQSDEGILQLQRARMNKVNKEFVQGINTTQKDLDSRIEEQLSTELNDGQ